MGCSRSFKNKEIKKIKPKVLLDYQWVAPFYNIQAKKKEDGTISYFSLGQKIHWSKVIECYGHLVLEEKKIEMDRLTQRYNLYRKILEEESEIHFYFLEERIQFRENPVKVFQLKHNVTTVKMGYQMGSVASTARINKNYRKALIEKEFGAVEYGALKKEWKLKKMFGQELDVEFIAQTLWAIYEKTKTEIEEMVEYLNKEIKERIEHITQVIKEETEKKQLVLGWFKKQ